MRYRSKGDVGSQSKYFQFWEPGQKLVRILIMVFLSAAEISAFTSKHLRPLVLANAFNRSENVINGSATLLGGRPFVRTEFENKFLNVAGRFYSAAGHQFKEVAVFAFSKLA